MPSAVPRAQQSRLFDVVAVGASAGGIDALLALLGPLPATFSLPLLVVLHLDPHRQSHLSAVLGRGCRLPVKEAADGELIVGGTVYVASPDTHLVVREGRIGLSDAGQVHHTRPAVDVLFDSVASAYGVRAIGVILSGAGNDGAVGMRRIKGTGGTTIVQDPLHAAHPAMPTAARRTGCVDMTLRLQDIGATLVALAAN